MDRRNRRFEGSRIVLVGVLLVVIASAAACTETGPVVKTAAQRIDDAVAAIAKIVGRDTGEVKATYKATLQAQTDEALALSLEGIAAKPAWASKAWKAASMTYELATSDEVKFVSDLICEALDQWEKKKPVTDNDLTNWAVQLTNLDSSNPSIGRVVKAAHVTLESQDGADLAYVDGIDATTCIIDKIPG